MCGLERRRAGGRIWTRREGKGKEMDEPCREEPCFCRLGMANTPSAFVPREGEGFVDEGERVDGGMER